MRFSGQRAGHSPNLRSLARISSRLRFPGMCGRSSLHDAPVSVLEHFHLPPVLPGFEPHYNIAPSQNQWAIALSDAGAPEVRQFKWGLVPAWADDPSIGSRMINARAETLASKSAWEFPVRKRRCLILADGYYEWATNGKTRTPYFFHLRGHRPFTMAGLWDRWERGGESIETCTVITTEAGPLASAVHHRMPVVFPIDRADEWLDESTRVHRALSLLRAYEDDLESYQVSKYVNTPANDSPECIVPAA
jgi:putative SOS response-associated peptidase YedK